MTHLVVIREFRQTDYSQVSDVVRSAYLSNVNISFFDALLREITFQLIVACAAIMYIFIGIPLPITIISIPLVLLFLYISIYLSLLVKSLELMQTKRPLQCWVAEACEPYFWKQNPQSVCHRILTEDQMMAEGLDIGTLHRKIIGTVSVSNCLTSEVESAWLFRLAVDVNYRHKGIASALVDNLKLWCKDRRYNDVQLVKPECLEYTTPLFVSLGFQMKRRYSKQVVGSIVTVFMSHLECPL